MKHSFFKENINTVEPNYYNLINTNNIVHIPVTNDYIKTLNDIQYKLSKIFNKQDYLVVVFNPFANHELRAFIDKENIFTYDNYAKIKLDSNHVEELVILFNFKIDRINIFVQFKNKEDSTLANITVRT